MVIKKTKYPLKSGKIINGYEVSFLHAGKKYTWRTTSYKEAVQFNKKMRKRG